MLQRCAINEISFQNLRHSFRYYFIRRKNYFAQKQGWSTIRIFDSSSRYSPRSTRVDSSVHTSTSIRMHSNSSVMHRTICRHSDNNRLPARLANSYSTDRFVDFSPLFHLGSSPRPVGYKSSSDAINSPRRANIPMVFKFFTRLPLAWKVNQESLSL